jgi:hypothetical protein
MAAETTSLHLRLPKGLYKRLQRTAKHNNVSLNTEIVNQLEGHEAATATRMAEALKPALDDSIKEAIRMAYRPTSRDQFRALLDKWVAGGADPVRTEPELAEQFRQMGFPNSDVVYFLQIFRERSANQK